MACVQSKVLCPLREGANVARRRTAGGLKPLGMASEPACADGDMGRVGSALPDKVHRPFEVTHPTRYSCGNIGRDEA